MTGSRVGSKRTVRYQLVRLRLGYSAAFVARVSWLVLLIALPAAFDPFGGFAVEPVKASVVRVLATVIAASYVIAVLLGALPRSTNLGRTEWFAVALLTSTGLSVVVSLDPLVSLLGTFDRDMGWLTLAAGVVLLLVGKHFLSDPVLRERSISALVIGAIVPCSYAIVQAIGYDPIQWTGVSGIVSTLGSPTFLGGYLVLVAPFALYRLILASQASLQRDGISATLQYSLWLGTFGVLVIVLMLCDIRGVVLGFVAGMLPMLCLLRPTKLTRRRVAGLAAVVTSITLVGTLSFHIAAPLVQRFLDAQDPSTHAGRSMVERLVLWQVAFALPPSNPERLVLGFGPEMQQAAFESVTAVIRLSPDEQFDRAHNLLLDTWLTGGLLGLGLLLLMIGSAVCSLWVGCRSTRSHDRVLAAAVVGALAGHLVEQSFAFPTSVTGTFFWVTLAFAVSLGATESYPPSPGTADCSPVLRPRPLVASLVACCALGLMPAMLAPAIADAIYGSALEAERTGSVASAAQRAETAAAWVPWVADLPLYAGLRWQEAAAGETGQLRDERLAHARHDLSDATQRAWWDPYTALRLAQVDVASAVSTSDPTVARDLLQDSQGACEQAIAISPHRPAIADGCAEVERSRAPHNHQPGT